MKRTSRIGTVSFPVAAAGCALYASLLTAGETERARVKLDYPREQTRERSDRSAASRTALPRGLQIEALRNTDDPPSKSAARWRLAVR